MTATKLFNLRTQSYQFVPDEELQPALLSGQFKLPSGATIRALDASGNKYDVDNQADFKSLNSLRFETNVEREERVGLEKAADQPVAAFVEGALRSATFGGYDAAAAAIGYADEVRRRKQANPVAAPFGEAAGIAASVFAMPGGGLVGQAGRAGEAVAMAAERRIAANVLEKAAEKGATSLGMDIAKRSAQAAITKGAGGFAEGAFYGLGETISEASLGDPGEAAAHLISNVGMASVLNGTLMGTFGAFGSIAKRPFAGMSKSETAEISGQMGSVKKTLTDVAAAFTEQSPQGDPSVLQNIMLNIVKVSDAARGLKPEVRETLQELIKSPARLKQVMDFSDNLPEAVMVSANTIRQARETGDAMSKWMATAGRSKVIREMPTQYAANKEIGEQVARGVLDTIDSALNRMSKERSLYDGTLARELKEIRKQFEGKFFRTSVEAGEETIIGGMGERIARKVTKEKLIPVFESNADLMEGTLDTWRAIFDLKKQYSDKLFMAMNRKAKRSNQLIDGLYSKISDLNFNEAAFGPEVVSMNKELNKGVAQYMGNQKEFNKLFGEARYDTGKKVIDVSQDKLSRYLKSARPDQVLKDDVFKRFAENFTQIVNTAKKFGFDEDLIVNGGASLDNMVSSVAQLEDMKSALFAIQSMESQTGKSLGRMILGASIGGVLGGPILGGVGSAVGYMVDNPYQTLRFLNRAQQMVIESKSSMQKALQKFANVSPKGDMELGEPALTEGSSIIRKVFEVPKVIRLGAVEAFDDEDIEKPVTLEQVLSSPTDQTVARVMEKHAELNTVMPAIQANMGAQVVAAIDFLKSKAPTSPTAHYNIFPTQTQYVIPDSTRQKFERYVDAINNPTGVLKLLADGKLTLEHVEALRAVYPNLYAESQRAVIEMLGQKPNLTYRQKVQLGLFMQAPTMPAYDPTIFASIQSQYAIANAQEQQQKQGMKVPQSLGQSQKTEFQQAMTR